MAQGKSEPFSLGWWIYSPVLIIAISFLFTADIRHQLYVVYFFVQGGLCAFEYTKCRRVHCQITGIGFMGVGVLALLNVLGIINIVWDIISGIFVFILILGYGIENRYKAKHEGSCYRE